MDKEVDRMPQLNQTTNHSTPIEYHRKIIHGAGVAGRRQETENRVSRSRVQRFSVQAKKEGTKEQSDKGAKSSQIWVVFCFVLMSLCNFVPAPRSFGT